MKVAELARKLRRRQCRRVPNAVLRVCDDEDVVWSYLQCPECRQKYVTTFLPLVSAVHTAEQFVDACNALIGIHQIEVHAKVVFTGASEYDRRPITADELRGRLPSVKPKQ